MYQGADPVVQGVSYDLAKDEDRARMWGMVDSVARFEYTDLDTAGHATGEPQAGLRPVRSTGPWATINQAA